MLSGEKQPWLKQREAFKPPANRPSPKYPRTVMNTLRRRDAARRPRTHARTRKHLLLDLEEKQLGRFMWSARSQTKHERSV